MEGAETRAKEAQEGPRLVIMMFMLMMLMMMKLEQVPTCCSVTAMNHSQSAVSSLSTACQMRILLSSRS